jgi:hypothetical protein
MCPVLPVLAVAEVPVVEAVVEVEEDGKLKQLSINNYQLRITNYELKKKSLMRRRNWKRLKNG